MSSHKRFSASASSRWIACPGSIQLVEKLLKEGKLKEGRTSSPAADLGTAVHFLIEKGLLREARPKDYLGKVVFEEGMVTPITISQTEVDSAEGCIRYAKRRKTHTKGKMYSEMSFDLTKVYKSEIGGTADITILNIKEGQLEIVDYKNGRWAVEVANNSQLRIYALGAYYKFRETFDIKSIRMTVYQPNDGHPDGAVRSEVLPLEELLTWERKVLVASLNTAVYADPPFLADDKAQCTWCDAKPFCETHHASKKEVVKDVTTSKQAVLKDGRLPEASSLSISQLQKTLENADEMLAFYASCKKEALARATAKAGSVPGWDVGSRMGNRKFIAKSQLIKVLEGEGFAKDDFHVSKIMTVTEMEKSLKLSKTIMSSITTRSISSTYLKKADGAVDDFKDFTTGDKK